MKIRLKNYSLRGIKTIEGLDQQSCSIRIDFDNGPLEVNTHLNENLPKQSVLDALDILKEHVKTAPSKIHHMGKLVSK